MRFEVVEMNGGKYKVMEVDTGSFVRFGYNNPPLFETHEKPAAVWNNYYSARGFADKLSHINRP